MCRKPSMPSYMRANIRSVNGLLGDSVCQLRLSVPANSCTALTRLSLSLCVICLHALQLSIVMIGVGDGTSHTLLVQDRRPRARHPPNRRLLAARPNIAAHARSFCTLISCAIRRSVGHDGDLRRWLASQRCNCVERGGRCLLVSCARSPSHCSPSLFFRCFPFLSPLHCLPLSSFLLCRDPGA